MRETDRPTETQTHTDVTRELVCFSFSIAGRQVNTNKTHHKVTVALSSSITINLFLICKKAKIRSTGSSSVSCKGIAQLARKAERWKYENRDILLSDRVKEGAGKSEMNVRDVNVHMYGCTTTHVRQRQSKYCGYNPHPTTPLLDSARLQPTLRLYAPV